jgi:hypothetical protein
MKKTYQVWSENSTNEAMSHEYNIHVNGEESKLIYSTQGWADPGGLVGKLLDDGDGIVIKGITPKPLKLDYMQAHQIYVMLAHNSGQWKNEIKETITIKQF